MNTKSIMSKVSKCLTLKLLKTCISDQHNIDNGRALRTYLRLLRVKNYLINAKQYVYKANIRSVISYGWKSHSAPSRRHRHYKTQLFLKRENAMHEISVRDLHHSFIISIVGELV